MKHIFSALFLILFLLTSHDNVTAQMTIAEQYEDLNKKGSNWQDYKMLKRNQLNTFYNNLSDTLKERNNSINGLNITIANKDTEIGNLKNELAETENLLEKTKMQKNSTVGKREMPSDVETLNEFRNTLLGCRIRVHMDHKNDT